MSTEVLAAPAPKTYSGLLDWLTTTDHKKIGLLYLGFAFIRPARAPPSQILIKANPR